MKKKFNVLFVSILLTSSILFSSCIGSFSLFNKLLSWNNTIGDKFINELIFVALIIVPVYEIAWAVDVIVLNSIEFWTDENPVAEGKVQKVEGKDGIYTVETKKDGYKISKEGSDDVVNFHFDKNEKTWNVEAKGESTTLLKIINKDEVSMYLPDGSTMNIPLNEAGVLAYKQVIRNNTYFAGK